jgi:CobQ/CobB/MinD/ParA nucleotide binding domain
MPNYAAGAAGAIHIILQGKGGVGKSFVALHLAQYFAYQDLPTATFDSDPASPTLAHYQALRARYVNLMADDDLDMTQFDVLANEIVGASKCVVVLDTGSSNFLPIVSYLRSNKVLEVLSEMGRHVVIHSVLVGGASARETLAGLVSTAEGLAADGYVAWLNSYFGPVVFDGKQFEETRAFGMIKDKLTGVVRIKQRSSATNVLHQNAMREMLRRHLTYKEALAMPEFSIWDRQRLRDAQRDVNDQLLTIFGSEGPSPSASSVIH